MSNPDLDRIRERIRQLRQMTTAAGCTEAEAMQAASLAMKLMDKYGLDDDELDLETADAPGVAGRRSVADELWWTVARICRCKAWYVSHGRGGGVTFSYFGRSADVAIATYLHELLTNAIRSETAAFKETAVYRRRRTRTTRNQAVRVFQRAMVDRLESRLWALWWLRVSDEQTADQIEADEKKLFAQLDQALERAGRQFTTANALKVTGASRFLEARFLGSRAAAKVSIEPGLSNANPVAFLK